VGIWNADGTGQPIILRGHERAVVSIAWSPDGTRIATASTNGARIWNVDSGQPTGFQAHTHGQVRSVAWSPDNTRVLTAGGDKTARVWTLDGSADPIVLPHHDELFSAAWSPDGKFIVTASGAPLAHVWPFEPERRTYLLAFQRALERSTDCLDPEQRQTHLSESKEAATEAYEACERRHGRTPGQFD
jgi:WD40 repeat protein